MKKVGARLFIIQNIMGAGGKWYNFYTLNLSFFARKGPYQSQNRFSLKLFALQISSIDQITDAAIVISYVPQLKHHRSSIASCTSYVISSQAEATRGTKKTELRKLFELSKGQIIVKKNSKQL